MNAIEIKNLRKDFDSFSLKIEDLKIPEGFVTGFIGPNGSGKTTTIKLILNMLSKDSGSIKLFGKEYKNDELSLKEYLGVVGEFNGYLQESKLSRIKSSLCMFYKNWDEKLYKRYMEEFGLNENKVYKELSKGQQKKFEIVMTLSHHPKIIIMDEPTANLDPLVRNEVLEMLQERIEKDNATVFFSTHITSDLDKIGDYFIAMDKGKIIFNEDIENIRNNYVIVKGRKELLNEETEEVFQYVTENEFGFRGISNNKIEVQDVFGEEVLYERPKMEDILILSKGKR